MMTVERKDRLTVKFSSLETGDVYKDQTGRICIKLNNDDTFNSLTFGINGDTWELTSEYFYDDVTPLKAKLTVWEEKEM